MIDPTSSDLNVVTVNGMPMPGRSTIEGAVLKYNWEKRPGYGRSGATLVYRGIDLCEPTLKIDMWLPEHFAQWETVKKLFDPPKIGSPASQLALGISHPLLADIGLANFVPKERPPPVRGTNGLWTVSIPLFEYRPPVPALVKPKGSVPAAGNGAGTSAQSEADKALEAEAKRNKELQARANQ